MTTFGKDQKLSPGLMTPAVEGLSDILGLGPSRKVRNEQEKLALLYQHFGRDFANRNTEATEHVLLELARATLPGFSVVSSPPRRRGRPKKNGLGKAGDIELVQPIYQGLMNDENFQTGSALSKAAATMTGNGTAKNLAANRKRLERFLNTMLLKETKRLEMWIAHLEGQLSGREELRNEQLAAQKRDK